MKLKSEFEMLKLNNVGDYKEIIRGMPIVVLRVTM